MGNQSDVYDIAVTSVSNCKPNGGYNLATPVANDQCSDSLHSAWRQRKHFSLAFSFMIQVIIKDMVERSLLAVWSIVLLLNTGPRK